MVEDGSGWSIPEGKRAVKAARRRLADQQRRERHRLGRGSVLARVGAKRRRGEIYVDEHGIYLAAGAMGRRVQEPIALWVDAVALDVSGNEKRSLSTHTSQRKSFTVRHTHGTAHTTETAEVFLVIALKDDEIVVQLPGKSPMRIRSLLGPVLSALPRERPTY